MEEHPDNVVPFWTLATQTTAVVPNIANDESMTPERLGELRTVLAALADAPIATLEAHPMPHDLDRTRGLHLDSTSPLATHLSQLISQASNAAPKAVAGAGGDVLYRMVVPAKVAAQVGTGLLKPMASKAGGVHSALMGSSGIAAQARFVPVAAGNATAAAGVGAAAAGAGALTIAAPLVLMAVAVGVSAHAEQQRQQAIENITTLLEKVHSDALQRERSALNGCRSAIEKATAILLDQGRIGASLGLDSAVHAIDVGLADAEERLKKWQRALGELHGGPVGLQKLNKEFAGIDQGGGEFRTQLELAELAIALKKRVIILQAVEHAQLDPSNPFEKFVGALRSDQKRVTELESGIAATLRQLSTIKLDRSRGLRDVVYTPAEVDTLLRASYQLRELGEGVSADNGPSDVAIEIARSADGSVLVFPAIAA